MMTSDSSADSILRYNWVVCILMNIQPMTHDDFRQFGSVEYTQQRTYY